MMHSGLILRCSEKTKTHFSAPSQPPNSFLERGSSSGYISNKCAVRRWEKVMLPETREEGEVLNTDIPYFCLQYYLCSI